MRILVIGAGAIGGWVGGRLAAHGHGVTLLGRAGLARAVAERGLRLQTPDDALVVRDVQVVTQLADAAPHGPFDLALFSVKAYDTDATVAQMERALPQVQGGRGTPPVILSLQNGVRSEVALAAVFGPERVVAGVELNPISTPEPGTVTLEKWKGGIGLAPLVPGVSIEGWIQLLNEAVLPTRSYRDYRAMKWSKLMLNLIGNASAAILDMSTVEVFEHPGLFELEVEMLRECAAVMRGLGIRPTGLPGYPVPWLAWGVRYAPLFLLKPVLRKLVAGGRGAKPPSMLLDLRRGKGRSEVDDLNGAVVRAGAETDLPTPVNRALTETLLGLVVGRLDWDVVRRQPEVLLAVVEGIKSQARSG